MEENPIKVRSRQASGNPSQLWYFSMLFCSVVGHILTIDTAAQVQKHMHFLQYGLLGRTTNQDFSITDQEIET